MLNNTISDPVSEGLRRVQNRIPPEVLELTFQRIDLGLSQSATWQEKLRNIVIAGIVIPDCNLIGGLMKEIDLKSEWLEDTNTASLTEPGTCSIYRIPPSIREYRSITGVIGLNVPLSGDYMYPAFNSTWRNGAFQNIANAILTSISKVGLTIRPTPKVIGPDLVQLIPAQFTHVEYRLMMMLAFDVTMQGLIRDAWDDFANLVLYATQAFIHNFMRIKIDRAAIEGGSDIQSIGQVIEEFANAGEKYDEARNFFINTTRLEERQVDEYLRMML